MKSADYDRILDSYEWSQWQYVRRPNLKDNVRDGSLHKARFMSIVNVIESYFAASAKIRAADIGCYPGVFGTILKRRFENIVLDGVGLGLSDEFKEKTKDIYTSLFEAELDPLYPRRYGGSTPPCEIPVADSSYDLLVASEIFEHLYNPLHFVSETSRILKEDGIMILTTPNICYMGNVLRLLAGKSICEKLETSHIFMDNDWRPHMRVYDRSEIRTLLGRGSFKEEKVLLLDNKEDRHLSNTRMKMKMFLIRLFYVIPRFRNQYIGVFRKKTGA